MKLARSIVLVLMALAILSGTAFSQKLNPGTKAAMKLLEMKAKGWIDLQEGGVNAIILVEPKVWNAMTHQQKYQLAKWGLDCFKEVNQREGKSILKVLVLDMTSRNELASAWVGGPAANRINVSK